MRCDLFSTFISLVLLLPAHAESNWLEWLSPKLRAVEQHRKETQRKLDALGAPMASHPAEEFGYLNYGKIDPADPNHWVQVDLRSSSPIEQIALLPVQTGGDSASIEYFPRRFRVDVSDDPEFKTFSPVDVFLDRDFADPGTAPVILDAKGARARYIRVTVSVPAVFALAELMVLSKNCNIALGCPVTASDAVNGSKPRWAVENLVDGRSALGPPVVRELLEYDGLYAGPPDDNSPVWMQVGLKEPCAIQEIRIHSIHARFKNDMPGYGFPLKFRVEAAMESDFRSPAVLLDASHKDFPNPGDYPLVIPGNNIRAQFVRVVLVQSSGFIHPQRFGLSEIEIYSEGTNVARDGEVRKVYDPTPKTKDWPVSLLIDGHNSYGKIIALPVWLKELRERADLEADLASVAHEHARLTLEAGRRVTWLFSGMGLMFLGGIGGVLLNAQRIRMRELARFRRQLANDLHDEIGSSLAAISVISESASEYPTSDPAKDFQKIHRIARETTDAMRETLWIVGSRTEVGIDLIEHLQLTATRMLPRQNVKWLELVETLPANWEPEARRQVFLFFKEALANIVRHSRADTVELSVRVLNNVFELEIRDNGRGFQANNAKTGIGLQSLRARAAVLKGSVEIQTEPGSGTDIVLRVPMKMVKTPLAKNL